MYIRLSYTGNLRAVHTEPGGGATNLHQPQQDHCPGHFLHTTLKEQAHETVIEKKKKSAAVL
jgi:hypothetical protein